MLLPAFEKYFTVGSYILLLYFKGKSDVKKVSNS